jgi:glycosyltransferase involved in cell wall biosynthesis
MTARVCLVTPGHLSTNPRLVKEADALSAAGYEVSVIAADFLPWASAADAEFRGRPWTVARRVRFGPSSGLPGRALQGLRLRGARALFRLGARTTPVLQAAGHPAGPDLVAAAAETPADLYIGHYPPGLQAAALAARRFGARFAYDAEDFHLGDPPPGPEHEQERQLLRALEAPHLARCAYVSAASPGIAKAYAEAYGIVAPTVILNVFPRGNVQGPAAPAQTPQRPSLYWFSQTIGPDRGLECAVRAIAKSRSRPHLYLRGRPAAGFRERLEALATEIGVSDRIHFLPTAQPAEMERLAMIYDAGFCGETGNTANRRIALTNKLFSFLMSGLAIVASDIPAHRELAGELGEAAVLYRTDDADSLAGALDGLFDDPERLALGRRASAHLGQTRYNWDAEQAILLRLVGQALERAR